MHIYDKRRFFLLLTVLTLISGGLLAWRFGWVLQIGKFFAADLTAENVTISANGITIVSVPHLAYGFGSLTWNGKEFENVAGHGTGIQTAWQNNERGECFNPTEAGSRLDGVSTTTTSVVLSHSSTANSFTTSLRPAYFLAPGETSPYCQMFDPSGSDTASNTTLVSDAVLTRTTTIGHRGISNVIEYRSDITLGSTDTTPTPLRYIVIESPATFLGGEFHNLYTYNPATDTLTPFDIAMYPYVYSTLPFVAMNDAGTHALGLYTDEIPFEGFPGHPHGGFLGYAYNDWVDSWGIIYSSIRIPKIPPAGRSVFVAGDVIHSRSFISIGTPQQVKGAMRELFAFYPAPGYAPAVSLLTCSAPVSSIAIGESTTVVGSGGRTRSYMWSAPGSIPSTGGGPSFAVTYADVGMKTITVKDGAGNTGTCEVSVERTMPTPTPPPGCYYQQVECFTTPCEPELVCPSPTPAGVPGDANSDGRVNIIDFNIVISFFGQSGSSIPGDVNRDGAVNILDFGIVVSHFGQ